MITEDFEQAKRGSKRSPVTLETLGSGRDFSERNWSDYYDAKSSLYRDLTTVLSIILGFLTVALFTGNVDTNPLSGNFVFHQHYYLVYPVGIAAFFVIVFGWRMVHWDRLHSESHRPKN